MSCEKIRYQLRQLIPSLVQESDDHINAVSALHHLDTECVETPKSHTAAIMQQLRLGSDQREEVKSDVLRMEIVLAESVLAKYDKQV